MKTTLPGSFYNSKKAKIFRVSTKRIQKKFSTNNVIWELVPQSTSIHLSFFVLALEGIITTVCGGFGYYLPAFLDKGSFLLIVL